MSVHQEFQELKILPPQNAPEQIHNHSRLIKNDQKMMMKLQGWPTQLH
jgi:hypothetical protein